MLSSLNWPPSASSRLSIECSRSFLPPSQLSYGRTFILFLQSRFWDRALLSLRWEFDLISARLGYRITWNSTPPVHLDPEVRPMMVQSLKFDLFFRGRVSHLTSNFLDAFLPIGFSKNLFRHSLIRFIFLWYLVLLPTVLLI